MTSKVVIPKEFQEEFLKAQKALHLAWQQKAEYKANNLIFFHEPYEWQKEMNRLVRENNTIVIPSPNKIGKSAEGACTVISWALGFEPWAVVEKDYPGAVKYKDVYYKPSSLGIKPPVTIRITGEDWTHHIGEVLVPELKKWAPVGTYKTKKNSQGVEFKWDWKNKSTFEFLTHDQEDKLFESWIGQGWWADEPPPQKKYTAMARGLFGLNGKALLTMTPLKEAWILDELILSGRSDVGFIENLTILDNKDYKNHDDLILKHLGFDFDKSEKYYDLLLYEDDKGAKAEKYLRDNSPIENQFIVKFKGSPTIDLIALLKFLRFIKDTPINEKPSRIFGTFKSLVGRVLKQYNQGKHQIKAFKVPPDWPVTAMIDFHLGTPQAISYYAVEKLGRHYVIDETWDNLSPDEIADDIIRHKKSNTWHIKRAYIDPLSKGDVAYMKNRLGRVEDAFTIISRKLKKHGITLKIASKDEKSGTKNIEKWLEGPNKEPILFFFDTLGSGSAYGHLFEILRWVYDDDGKPKDEYDHFMENLYRYTLTGAKWREIKPKKTQTKPPVDPSTGW